jgi:hypothetical protein
MKSGISGWMEKMAGWIAGRFWTAKAIVDGFSKRRAAIADCILWYHTTRISLQFRQDAATVDGKSRVNHTPARRLSKRQKADIFQRE